MSQNTCTEINNKYNKIKDKIASITELLSTLPNIDLNNTPNPDRTSKLKALRIHLRQTRKSIKSLMLEAKHLMSGIKLIEIGAEFREITIPNEPMTAESYIEKLEGSGYKVGNDAKYILSKADLTEGQGETHKIVILSVEQLGFPNGATRAEIEKRAKELGLGKTKLPPRIGPELRLQYPDQPKGEYILIDMENIFGRIGNPRVFSVYHDDDGRWLGAYGGPSGFWWDGSDRWAFSLD